MAPEPATVAKPAVESGSFRDRDSRVVVAPDGIYRLLSRSGEADWRAFRDSGLLADLISSGKIVDTEEASLDAVSAEIREALPGGAAALLRHERIPFVSYPYEWTFSMLQDAALLQLDLQLAALDNGLTLKDATPYNVQFRGGAQPTFIDLGSFEPLTPGDPWVGYRQFCMLFLYPLLFQSYKDIPFQPWLRGSIDGIPPATAAAVFSLRDRFRRGVFMHAAMHARIERKNQAREGGDVRQELKKANFKPEMIRANVAGLRKLVGRLTWKAGETAWTGYRQDNTYTDEDAARKQAFVGSAAAELKPDLAWDMGCNDGAYARLVAEHSKQVVAFDFDHATVEALYRSLREEGNSKILPLVGNLADPSPGLGWRGAERRRLEDRGRPDLVLALALIHHVSISANVPIAEFLDWLRELGATTVIEFPNREDPMVKRLLSGKSAGANVDYDHDLFERELRARFKIERQEELPSGTRTLYLAKPIA